MCAILDASVVPKIFGARASLAGREFQRWITSGRGQLVIGGKLRRELADTRARDWLRDAIGAGRVRQLNDIEVDERAEQLVAASLCKSDDPHVIALAQLSGARLLYSNDGDLRHDFKKKDLLSSPRGVLYPMLDTNNAKASRKRLFATRYLCIERN